MGLWVYTKVLILTLEFILCMTQGKFIIFFNPICNTSVIILTLWGFKVITYKKYTSAYSHTQSSDFCFSNSC